MTAPELHPWLSTDMAVEAARKAVQIPLSHMAAAALSVGKDELFSEALAILTECALPPREPVESSCAMCGGSLEGKRKGAKFCSFKCRDLHKKRVARGKAETVKAMPQAHVGSMWTWPEGNMSNYAAKTVGYVLLNYIRTRKERVELPDSEALANRNLPIEDPEATPREVITTFLEAHGLTVDGSETLDELAAAAYSIKGMNVTEHKEAA